VHAHDVAARETHPARHAATDPLGRNPASGGLSFPRAGTTPLPDADRAYLVALESSLDSYPELRGAVGVDHVR